MFTLVVLFSVTTDTETLEKCVRTLDSIDIRKRIRKIHDVRVCNVGIMFGIADISLILEADSPHHLQRAVIDLRKAVEVEMRQAGGVSSCRTISLMSASSRAGAANGFDSDNLGSDLPAEMKLWRDGRDRLHHRCWNLSDQFAELAYWLRRNSGPSVPSQEIDSKPIVEIASACSLLLDELTRFALNGDVKS